MKDFLDQIKEFKLTFTEGIIFHSFNKCLPSTYYVERNHLTQWLTARILKAESLG